MEVIILNIFHWIEERFSPQFFSSDQFIYEDMQSQSCYSLPLVYFPFNSEKIEHWTDRGAILDFLCATQGRDKEILDFGPGDGWPSLPLAPFARKITGLDSSLRRVEACWENARRMDLGNVEFKFYDPESSLPFADNTFDGVVAASSIEQTPDPRRTLQELYRVLKPGGRIRFSYEALGIYRDGGEKDYFTFQIRENRSKIIFLDRKIDQEKVLQYALTLDLDEEEVLKMLTFQEEKVSLENIPEAVLSRLEPHIIFVQKCQTFHPSGKTFLSWLTETGFKECQTTRTGKEASREIFLQLEEGSLPRTLGEIDRLLLPAVQEIVTIPVSPLTDSMITAVK